MINIPKGTKDMLPAEAYKWHYVEDAARRTAALFGFKEIRTPIFEYTELFVRGVGETTDVVNKEMYTFLDKGGRSLTLKPEGTAGVARSFVENGLAQGLIPLKVYYIAPVFRYERPQNGRLREHHQFGVEMFGSELPKADAEIILLAYTFLREVGLTNLTLNINSIGCKECRKAYNVALKEYIGANLDSMCPTCKSRFDKNPLRILDCKEEKCRKITEGAPDISDYLCDGCKAHFEGVKEELTALDIPFIVNSKIVRGLDYYTRTVFEFVSDEIGAQGTVCGGGRYNHLVEEVGGKPTPAAGFGLGLERLLMVLENSGKLKAEDASTAVYIAPLDESAFQKALTLVKELRAKGISTETDLMERSAKSQLKYADKLGARYVIVIGENEIASGKADVKKMSDGSVENVDINKLGEYFTND